MKTENYHVVVSWSGADDEDGAMYLVCLYKRGSDDVFDFLSVGDNGSGQEQAGIDAAIVELAREYKLDATRLTIEYDI